jgi:hypothetical protein
MQHSVLRVVFVCSYETQNNRKRLSLHQMRGEGGGGFRVGTEEGFCTSMVGNNCFAPICRPLADSTACDDTSAMANSSTRQLTVSKEREAIRNNSILNRRFLSTQ